MYLLLEFRLNNLLLRLKMMCVGAELTRLLGNKKSVQYTNKLNRKRLITQAIMNVAIATSIVRNPSGICIHFLP